MVLAQTEPKKIYLGEFMADMRGPCTEGFHIPTKAQWVEVYNDWKTLGGGNRDATNFGIALKLPFAGYRDYDMTVRVVGSTGFYWTCEANSNSPTVSYALDFSSIGSGNISTGNSYYRAVGYSIRAFKDVPVKPMESWTKMYGTSIESGGIFWDSINGLISISGDGSIWITMEDKNLGATTVWNGGDTLTDDNCGYFYQWGNNYGFAHSGAVSYSYNKVDASNYGPGNYYNDSTFRYISSAPNNWDSSDNLNLWGGVTGPTTGGGDIEVHRVYVGNIQVRPTIIPITTPGIYHNSNLGLISLSSDGTNWITIADKNLGATQVYNNGDTLSEANAGKFYQWGNNYGFSFGVSPATISSTQANAGNNGPGNYYSSSTFITVTGSPTQDNSWDSSYNENLRGGVTDTNEARRGPCPIGYHVPSKNDVDQLGLLINALGVSNIETYLKIPFAGRLLWTNGSYQTAATSTYSWTSDISKSETLQRNYRGYMLYTYSTGFIASEALKSAGFSIRPFKNEAVQPDDTRTKLN